MLAKLDRQDRFRIPAPDENRRQRIGRSGKIRKFVDSKRRRSFRLSLTLCRLGGLKSEC